MSQHGTGDEELEQHDEFALRPIELPDREVLATAAANAPTYATLTRLARLLDPHGTRGSEVLRFPQAKALAQMLPTGDLDRARAAGITVRSMKQLPEVRSLHRLALAGGLLTAAGAESSASDDEDALDGWWRFFSTLLERGILAATMQDGDLLREIVDSLVIHVLVNYYASDAMTCDQVADVLRGGLEDVAAPLVDGLDEVRDQAVDDALHQFAHRIAGELAGLGVVDPARLDEVPAHAITPLGLWAVNRVLRDLEVDAPVFGELADADARTLIDVSSTWGLEDGQREIVGWVAARGALGAAGELAELARTSDDPGTRQLAIAILFSLDAAAEPVVRSLRDNPLLGPYAAIWLVDEELEDASILDDIDRDGAIRAITDDLTALFGPDAINHLPSQSDPRVAGFLTALRPPGSSSAES